MALAFTWLAPDFATSAQMTPDDVAEAAAAGFRSIVNNRPDFEGGPSQPTSQAMQQAATVAGLQYAFVPVQPAFQTPEEIARMRDVLAALPKPVLGFCRSGTRTGNLFRAAKGSRQ
jgi:uncharacterized protein (TIGR01244 family)